MFVLSRKEQEWICIGDDVRVCVCEIRGDVVRIGIEAPRHVEINRQEIWIRKQRQKENCD